MQGQNLYQWIAASFASCCHLELSCVYCFLSNLIEILDWGQRIDTMHQFKHYRKKSSSWTLYPLQISFNMKKKILKTNIFCNDHIEWDRNVYVRGFPRAYASISGSHPQFLIQSCACFCSNQSCTHNWIMGPWNLQLSWYDLGDFWVTPNPSIRP